MTTSYNVGDSREFRATFTDKDNNPVDPTTVTGTVREPDGNLSNPTINNISTGVYAYNYEFSQTGRHILSFLGDGAANAYHETEVWIKHKGAQ